MFMHVSVVGDGVWSIRQVSCFETLFFFNYPIFNFDTNFLLLLLLLFLNIAFFFSVGFYERICRPKWGKLCYEAINFTNGSPIAFCCPILTDTNHHWRVVLAFLVFTSSYGFLQKPSKKTHLYIQCIELNFTIVLDFHWHVRYFYLSMNLTPS